MITKLVPKAAKSWLKARIKNIAREDKSTFSEIKYIPYKFWSDSFLIPKSPEPNNETCSLGLAVLYRHCQA